MPKTVELLTIRKGLFARNIRGFTPEEDRIKNAFIRDARAFLTSLAEALMLAPGEYELRTNKAGVGVLVSGEVGLFADHLFVEVGESCIMQGISILYRSRKNRKDFSGGRNHWSSIETLKDLDKQIRFVRECQALIAQAQAEAALAA